MGRITAQGSLGSPKPKSHLTDIEISSILSFAEAGWPTRRIAKKLHRSQSVVSRTLRNYEFESFITRKPRPKSKRKTTPREDRLLVRYAKKNDYLPFRDITNISGLPVSTATLRRRLKEVELYSRVRRRKPFLTPQHKKARLEWANRYKDWTTEDWKQVIWSDECPIQLGQPVRRQRCIRKKGEAYKENHCVPTFKSGQVTIMVWACFTGDRLGPLIVCEEGGVDGDAYSEILFDGLLSLIDDLLEIPQDATTVEVASEQTFLFMHDNAPCHKTENVKELLKEANVPVMKWPAQSPDLNPLENLWVSLKEQFRKLFFQRGYRPSHSAECLLRCERLLQEVWQNIGQELVDALISSMRKRIDLVIAAEGGHTKY